MRVHRASTTALIVAAAAAIAVVVAIAVAPSHAVILSAAKDPCISLALAFTQVTLGKVGVLVQT